MLRAGCLSVSLRSLSAVSPPGLVWQPSQALETINVYHCVTRSGGGSHDPGGTAEKMLLWPWVSSGGSPEVTALVGARLCGTDRGTHGTAPAWVCCHQECHRDARASRTTAGSCHGCSRLFLALAAAGMTLKVVMKFQWALVPLSLHLGARSHRTLSNV